MATTPFASAKRNDVVFTPGEPQVVSLKFAQGRTIETPFGMRVMYTTEDDRRFFLDPEPARDIEMAMRAQGIGARTPFLLTKVRQPKGGYRWVVECAEEEHAEPAPTELETKLAQSVQMAQSGQPFPPPAVVAGAASQPISPTASRLMGAFLSAIDAIAEAQAYANRKGLGVTFTAEDIRSTAISAYIQVSRDGGAR